MDAGKRILQAHRNIFAKEYEKKLKNLENDSFKNQVLKRSTEQLYPMSENQLEAEITKLKKIKKSKKQEGEERKFGEKNEWELGKRSALEQLDFSQEANNNDYQNLHGAVR